MLLRYAAEHGYTVQEVYIDEDYSGADRRRPAFNQMLAAAERREFDVILAKTQSRFTRDMELVEKYLHGKFAEWGIRFIAVVDHVDTQDRPHRQRPVEPRHPAPDADQSYLRRRFRAGPPPQSQLQVCPQRAAAAVAMDRGAGYP